MSYGTPADKIVAYTYNAETLCPECTLAALGGVPSSDVPRQPHGVVEKMLALDAEARGIDRMDEKSYDSSEFPKVVFACQIEGDERCDHCGEVLV